LLKEAGIPSIITGVRTNSLTDRDRKPAGWLPALRRAPTRTSGCGALILIERWRDSHFAIVDDGTIYSRELAEGFRNAAEQAGLKPVFVDTYRPQLDNQIALVGGCARRALTNVFIAGDRADIAIIGRDAAQLGYPLTIAGGEVLRAAPDEVDLAEGTLMVSLPEWAEIADPDDGLGAPSGGC
jgi:branched-chain amino acid transport system substrate-binding protein